ncbi:MAG TPA: MBL fold metallo-hydrolase [Spirochaetia bacterium]|nr:MBL fold metallo-hydrolase [Spirochaetia bacterium]
MENVLKAAEDIFLITQTVRENWFCSVTLIVGRKELGLVDTGFENTPEEFIFPFLKEIGRRPSEITQIVNTHRDGDHVLGNAVVKRETGARIAAHELEIEAIRDVDIRLKDGQAVELGDRRFTALHAPGHRPGNICLYDEANRTLLAGDTIVGDRKDLIRMSPEIYVRSLRKLQELEVDLLIMAHPFQPAGKAILNREEAMDMMRKSLTLAGVL